MGDQLYSNIHTNVQYNNNHRRVIKYGHTDIAQLLFDARANIEFKIVLVCDYCCNNLELTLDLISTLAPGIHQ